MMWDSVYCCCSRVQKNRPARHGACARSHGLRRLGVEGCEHADGVVPSKAEGVGDARRDLQRASQVVANA
jgi:hypothetical protein